MNIINWKRSWLCASALTLAVLTSACVVQEHRPAPPPVVYVRQQPPVELVEQIPPRPPGPYWVWQKGHWRWNGHQYFWTPGHWKERPPQYSSWAPPYWETRSNGYFFVEGHWK